MLAPESLFICLVKQGVTSEFLTVHYFILKVDVSQFIGELCLVRSYHNIAGRCKPELEKKLIRKSSWEKDSMILPNFIIQWNPIFVPSFASDLRKIFRLTTFSEHDALPLTLSQEEVFIELEKIIAISVLNDFSCEFNC